MLESNRRRIQNLTGLEIWLFIAGRVLVAFGLGILAMTYYPVITSQLAWPAMLVGSAMLVGASRGFFRRS